MIDGAPPARDPNAPPEPTTAVRTELGARAVAGRLGFRSKSARAQPARAGIRGIPLVADERGYLVLVVLLYAVFVLSLALTRDYLGYGTETDFVGAFVPEAQRVLSGEPTESSFHPPGYPILLALTYALVGDWMTSGLLISGLAGLAVVLTAYLFFHQLCGRAAAWGALLGLFGSIGFLGFSVQATTDVFFLALFSASCLLALRGSSTGSPLSWAMCGAIIGVAVMTRTNGLPLLLLLLLPFTSSFELRSKLRQIGAGALGLGAVALALAAYAAAVGSDLLPSRTYLSVAMTYFTEEPRAAEGMVEAEQRFTSTADVLTHDPVALVTGYIWNLYHLVSLRLVDVVTLPLVFLFPVGLLMLIGRFPSATFLLFLATILAEVMLVNFKAFESRYYLFLAPWIGACAGQVIWFLWRADWPPLGRRLVTGLLVTGIVLAVGLAATLAARGVLGLGAELAEVVPSVQGRIPDGAKIVARKPHLAFYTDGTSVYLPELETLTGVRDYLGSVAGDQPAFLFYGRIERDKRTDYRALSDPDAAPDWLVELARGTRPGSWVLFRYRGQVDQSDP